MAAAIACAAALGAQQPQQPDLRAAYTKSEHMIAMRDGVRLLVSGSWRAEQKAAALAAWLVLAGTRQ